MIDVAAGEKIPRKGGPGITRSDLLVINKVDLAPLVGADLGIMERDAARMRGRRPFLFTNMKSGAGVDALIARLLDLGGLDDRLGVSSAAPLDVAAARAEAAA